MILHVQTEKVRKGTYSKMMQKFNIKENVLYVHVFYNSMKHTVLNRVHNLLKLLSSSVKIANKKT